LNSNLFSVITLALLILLLTIFQTNLAQGAQTKIRINWLKLCENPLLDAAIAEPCQTLTSPDGYSLTSEGQRVLRCIAGGGLLLLVDHTGQALMQAQAFGPAVGCGAGSGSPPGSNPSSQNLIQPGSNPSSQNHIQVGGNYKVTIVAGSSSPENPNFFDPKTLVVPRGSSVTWRNDDTTLHTVTSGSAQGGESGTVFDSSYLASGKKFQWAFSKSGTFDYYCTLHPYMSGKIIVSAGEGAPSKILSNSLKKPLIQDQSANVKKQKPFQLIVYLDGAQKNNILLFRQHTLVSLLLICHYFFHFLSEQCVSISSNSNFPNGLQRNTWYIQSV